MAQAKNHCPKCGENENGRGINGIVYKCFSGQVDGEWVDGITCLRRQLAQANERIIELERVAEAACKVTHGGPVYVSELREVLQELDGKGAERGGKDG